MGVKEGVSQADHGGIQDQTDPHMQMDKTRATLATRPISNRNNQGHRKAYHKLVGFSN